MPNEEITPSIQNEEQLRDAIAIELEKDASAANEKQFEEF
jgi:hypothetical protein